MSLPFTGQESLTGFALKLSDLLWLNEVGRRDPYKLYHAETESSGFSFGALQWDLPNHQPLEGAVQAKAIFRDIMQNAVDSSGQRIVSDAILLEIEPLLDTEGDPDLLDSYKTLIDAALNSAYGRQKIDENHINEIGLIVQWVDQTVALVSDPFLSGSEAARLFIGDLRNQFSPSVNNNLRKFLQGIGEVNLGTGIIRKTGTLDLSDILNFYFSTPYASTNKGLNDELRRFNNIISLTGGVYALSGDEEAQESEAKGLIRIYQDFLKEKEPQLSNTGNFKVRVLEPARVELITKYVNNENLLISVNGEVIVGEDATSFNRNQKHTSESDALDGSSQNDLILGEDGDDFLSGSGARDILYGGDGNDTLSGSDSAGTEDGAGDYLFGENGFDIYHVGNGDIIKDTDGLGRVFYNGSVLSIGYHAPEQDVGEYFSIDGQFTYSLNNGDLIVTVNGPTPVATFTIQDYAENSLGIELRNMPNPVYASAYQVTQQQGWDGLGNGQSDFIGDNFPNPTGDYDPATHDAIIGRAGNTYIGVAAGVAGVVIYGDGPNVAPEQQGMDAIEMDLDRHSRVASGEIEIPPPVEGALVYAQGGHDFVGGTMDHDWIDGGSGHDAIISGLGDDTLIGGTGNDFMTGARGNDVLIGGSLSGIPSGDSDNNMMSGEWGDDYIFGGTGSDWIYGDTHLGVGMLFVNLETAERGWMGEHFPAEGMGQFFDLNHEGQAALIVEDALFGDPLEGAGNDTIDAGAGDDDVFAGAGNDVVSGGTGKDTLLGEAGDDLLQGGAGEDHLYGDFYKTTYINDSTIVIGQSVIYGDFVTRLYRDPLNTVGHDVLDGGADHDELEGGYGNDTYVFGRGYGLDVVYDISGTNDKVRLGPGIAPEDVALTITGSHLRLSLLTNGVYGDDHLVLNNWFSPDHRVEQILFSDGTQWSVADILEKIGLTSQQADALGDAHVVDEIEVVANGVAPVVGTRGNDVVYLLGGNRSVSTGEGDDRVNSSGPGNQYILDIDGNERYVFDPNWGRDAIEDQKGTDELVFTAGVDPSAIRFLHDGNDLYLSSDDGSRIAFRNWFSEPSNRIERISFADGTVWEGATLSAQTNRVAGTAGSNTLSGYSGSDDVLHGLEGNDVLNGLDGADSLEGGVGDDELRGGAGDDVLIGGDGNDVYVMDTGMDTVRDEGGTGETNTVRLARGVTVDDVDAEFDGDNLILNWGSGNGVTIEGYALNPSVWQFQLASGAPVSVEAFFADPVVADGGSSGGSSFINSVLNSYEQYRYQDLVDNVGLDVPSVFERSASIIVLGPNGEELTHWPEGYEPINVPSGSGEQEAGRYFPEEFGALGDFTWVYNGPSMGGLHRDFVEVVRATSVTGAQPASVNVSTSEGAQLVLAPFALGGGVSHRQVIGVILDKDIANGLENTGSGLRAIAPLGEQTHFLRIFDLGDANDSANLGANSAGSLIDSGGGNDSITSGNSNDLLYGADGNDFLSAGTGSDILLGGNGDDILEDARGVDVLMGMQGDDGLTDRNSRSIFQGGEGHDVLDAGGADHTFLLEHDPNSNDEFATLPTQAGSLLDGGSGNDFIIDTGSSDLIAGGSGDDFIRLAGGEDVIVFNRGDGHDLIELSESTEQQRTLSLGGGIEQQDIRLQRFGEDLVVHTGNAEYIILMSWYTVTDGLDEGEVLPITHLQIINEPVIRQYDFSAIVEDFDAALLVNPELGLWAIENSAAAAELGDYTNQAIGGNPAYQYGVNGNFAGLRAGDVLNIMRNEHFGRANQLLTATGEGANYGVLNFANGWIALQGSGATEALPNEAPVAEQSIGEQIAGVGQDFQFQIPGNTFRDTDIQDYLGLGYTARLADGSPLPAWLSFNPAARTFSGAPQAGDLGTFVIEVTVTDSAGQSAVTEFTLEVNDDGLRTIMGTEDDDQIDGFTTADRILGLGGNDVLFGDSGDDVIDGGNDNDQLIGASGDDELLGGNGNDLLYGDSGNDILNGGAGDDFMDGGEGNDSLEDSDGGDTIYKYHVSQTGIGGHDVIQDAGGVDSLDVISGLAQQFELERNGNDLKLVFSPSDSLTIENWFLSADHKIESIRYENALGEIAVLTPHDIADLLGPDGLDTITGTEGDDIVEGTSAAEKIFGLGGNDEIYGLQGDDIIDGGEGNNIIQGGAGDDTITAESGDDSFRVTEGDGHDVIEDAGGLDSIEIRLESELNYSYGRVGDDLLIAYTLNDSITVKNWFLSADHQVETIDISYPASGEQVIVITAQEINESVSNTIFGTNGDDVIAGDAYSNQIFGMDGNDAIDGGGGMDYLEGGAGDDELAGGTGDYDYLVGGSDNDTYVFNRGDGQDSIYDEDGVDTIQFGVNIAVGDITVTRDPYNLYLNLNNSGGRLVLQNWYIGAEFQIEQVVFTGGTTWNVEMLESLAIEAATEYDDALYGTTGDDTLDGGNGHDFISGDAGNDTLIGGNGDDNLDGGSGNDILSAGAGDTRYNYYVTETGLGGHDVISDMGGLDSIYISSGLTQELEIERSGNDLKLILSSSDSLTIQNWFLSLDHQIESIEYDHWGLGEFTVLTSDDINELLAGNTPPVLDNPLADQLATAGAAFTFEIPAATFSDVDGDTLLLTATRADGSALPSWLSFDALTGTFSGTPQAGDVMALQLRVTASDGSESVFSDFRLGFVGASQTGTPGNDSLSGGNGDDQLAGGLGNDTLSSSLGNDFLLGEDGNDVLYAGGGEDQLFGGTGNDTLYGDAGNDQQFGGAGTDSLMGGAGSDLLDGGDGTDYAYYSSSSTAVQVDLNANTAAGGDAQGDTLISIEHLWGSTWNDSLTGNAGANFLMGNSGNDTLTGLGGNDGLYGGNGDDQLAGGEGNDTLYGDAHNDTLTGGAGTDYLMGGTGSDVYHFNLGDDRDYLREDTAGIDTASTDRVVFGAGIDADELWFTREGNHLWVWVDGTDDWLQVDNWYSNAAPGIEQFETSAGDILLASEVQQLVDAMAVFDPSDSGVMNIPPSAQDQVAPVIAENWS
jgi:Ca2+-binding RTX toxin-like protein